LGGSGKIFFWGLRTVARRRQKFKFKNHIPSSGFCAMAK
jgi:hypothetical protein